MDGKNELLRQALEQVTSLITSLWGRDVRAREIEPCEVEVELDPTWDLSWIEDGSSWNDGPVSFSHARIVGGYLVADAELEGEA